MRPFWALLICGGLLLAPSIGWAATQGVVYAEPPEVIEAEQRYLFYMHGRWIEMHGLRVAHPRHGRYHYQRIVDAIAARGFVVISEARNENVRPPEYAARVAAQVRRLLAAGVPGRHITVIGHSKGGMMTLIAASIIRHPAVRYVVMAGCGRAGSPFRRIYGRFLDSKADKLRGRILSIYDQADQSAGTCREAFSRTPRLEGEEIVLTTGRGHGVFYAPREVWIDVIVRWAKQ